MPGGAKGRAQRISSDGKENEGGDGDGTSDRDTCTNDTNQNWFVSIEVTEKDLIGVLKRASCYGLLETKRAVLKEIVSKKKQLAGRILIVCNHLHDSFNTIVPDTPGPVDRSSAPEVVSIFSSPFGYQRKSWIVAF